MKPYNSNKDISDMLLKIIPLFNKYYQNIEDCNWLAESLKLLCFTNFKIEDLYKRLKKADESGIKEALFEIYVARWLLSNGVTIKDFEKKVENGKRPDFFCELNGNFFYVEVRTIRLTAHVESIVERWGYLVKEELNNKLRDERYTHRVSIKEIEVEHPAYKKTTTSGLFKDSSDESEIRRSANLISAQIFEEIKDSLSTKNVFEKEYKAEHCSVIFEFNPDPSNRISEISPLKSSINWNYKSEVAVDLKCFDKFEKYKVDYPLIVAANITDVSWHDSLAETYQTSVEALLGRLYDNPDLDSISNLIIDERDIESRLDIKIRGDKSLIRQLSDNSVREATNKTIEYCLTHRIIKDTPIIIENEVKIGSVSITKSDNYNKKEFLACIEIPKEDATSALSSICSTLTKNFIDHMNSGRNILKDTKFGYLKLNKELNKHVQSTYLFHHYNGISSANTFLKCLNPNYTGEQELIIIDSSEISIGFCQSLSKYTISGITEKSESKFKNKCKKEIMFWNSDYFVKMN